MPWRFVAALIVILALACGAARAKPESLSLIVRDVAQGVPEDAPILPTQSSEPMQLPTPPKSAGVRIEVLPGREFAVGGAISFRVTAEKAGYVVLVDVDSEGRLSQIYPNVVTLAEEAGVDEKANFLRAGQTITLPPLRPDAKFRFIASQPKGVGMVMAILSDTPVQVIDLPDVPPELAGQVKASEYLIEAIRGLQIMPADAGRAHKSPKWLFATEFYGIK